MEKKQQGEKRKSSSSQWLTTLSMTGVNKQALQGMNTSSNVYSGIYLSKKTLAASTRPEALSSKDTAAAAEGKEVNF